VFIVLGGIQIVATALIMLFAARYKDTPCPIHLPGQPTAKTAAEAATAGHGPGCRRLVGLSAAAPAAPPNSAGHYVRTSRSYTRFLVRSPARSGREADVQVVRSWPRPRIAGVSSPGSGHSPAGLARAYASQRCANAAVHTFGSPGFPATYLKRTT
jgi:hypothetical protein